MILHLCLWLILGRRFELIEMVLIAGVDPSLYDSLHLLEAPEHASYARLLLETGTRSMHEHHITTVQSSSWLPTEPITSPRYF